MADESIHLFVYGTLMPGYGNHGQIEHLVRNARPATTPGALLDLGAYPAMVPGDGIVRGVVLEVEVAALTITDHIEDFVPGREPNLYEREKVSVDLDHGELVRAWTYFFAAVKATADRPKLIIGERDGKPIYGWDSDGSHLLPKDRHNGSNS